MKAFLLNKKGFTLVELMIAIALLGIVMTLGYSYYYYGTRSFSVGESQATVQQEVRTASRTITSEIRNATRVSSSEFDDEALFYCIKRDGNNRLIIDTIDNGVTSSRQLTGNIITNSGFELKQENNKYLLRFTLYGNDSTLTNDYSIVSEILLNNVNNGNLGTWNTIYYTKP